MILSEEIRAQLIDVLIRHWATNTSGCVCGRVKLGGSYPEHIADVLEKRLEGLHDQAKPDRDTGR
jgi:hypothetical protein